MNIEFMGLSDVNGPLIALDGVTDACYEEMVDITVGDNDHRVGRIIRIEGAETGIVLSCKQLVDATGEVALGTRQLENGL